LMTALQNDPQGTVKILAEQVGYQPTGRPAAEEDYEQEDVDPQVAQLRRELQEQSRIVEQLSGSQAQQQIQAQLDELTAQYGADMVDAQAVVQHALDMGATNLSVAFKDLKFDSLATPTAPAAVAETEPAPVAAPAPVLQNTEPVVPSPEDLAALANKRLATGVVQEGDSAPGAAPAVEAPVIVTPQDAGKAAIAQLFGDGGALEGT